MFKTEGLTERMKKTNKKKLQREVDVQEKRTKREDKKKQTR